VVYPFLRRVPLPTLWAGPSVASMGSCAVRNFRQ
jgi:hypothetical protein